MAYELDAQHPFTIPNGGIRGDIGYIDFSGGSATLDVATTLSRCWGGFGIAADVSGQTPTLVASTDGDVTNGVVTFTRWGGETTADQRFWYIIFGV